MLFFCIFSLLLQFIFCDKVTICEDNNQTISCPSNQVVRINSAQWGRTSTCVCLRRNVAICQPITAINGVKQICDGKNTCTLVASNNLVGGTSNDPCYGIYKYLDVDYTCETNANNVQVCEGSRLAIDCPANTLIRVLSAIYGRHSANTPCPSAGADQFVYCGLEETNLVKLVCDGLQSCNMEASIQTFKKDPCVGTYKYTDVDYVCESKIPGEQRQTACDGQTFSISCQSPATIQVIQADYGRHSKTICPSTGADWNTQCATNQTDNISQRCNGHTSCTFNVNSAVFPQDPCVGTYKYVNVRYLCR